MKALILAAGQGTRIREVHGSHPKCLIQFDHAGWTILDQQIEALFAAGADQIGIVVGYEKDQVIRYVERNYRTRGHWFQFIENPVFAETNNIYSFWLAREWVAGAPFVCLNADVVFDSEALIPAVQASAPITMILDHAWRDETMKVVIEDGRITRMSKQISREEFSATYIGITVFQAAVQKRLFTMVQDLISGGNRNVFFNAAVQQLADDGLTVGYVETDGLPWAEIDDPGDLAFARRHVFPQLRRFSLAA